MAFSNKSKRSKKTSKKVKNKKNNSKKYQRSKKIYKGGNDEDKFSDDQYDMVKVCTSSDEDSCRFIPKDQVYIDYVDTSMTHQQKPYLWEQKIKFILDNNNVPQKEQNLVEVKEFGNGELKDTFYGLYLGKIKLFSDLQNNEKSSVINSNFKHVILKKDNNNKIKSNGPKEMILDKPLTTKYSNGIKNKLSYTIERIDINKIKGGLEFEDGLNYAKLIENR